MMVSRETAVPVMLTVPTCRWLVVRLTSLVMMTVILSRLLHSMYESDQ